MRRNPELIRAILLQLEKKERRVPFEYFCVSGYEPFHVAEHLHLMYQAGLIEGGYRRDDIAEEGVAVHFLWLTHKGYDLMDNVRNETVWKMTMERIEKTVGTASIGLIGEVAAAMIRQMLFSSLEDTGGRGLLED